MTISNTNTDRDAVLFTFHKECNNPTAAQIADWIIRYPQHADEIRAHAAIIKDWAAREGLPVTEPDAGMMSRSRSRAMDALYKAQQAASAAQSGATASTFDQIFAMRGTDVPALSRKLDISRGILAALVSGRMIPPVGERLVAALTDALSMTVQMFNAALQRANDSPRLGQAKAEGTPGVIPRRYEDLVLASPMSDERKRYWLGED
jgi:hypothetical protein